MVVGLSYAILAAFVTSMVRGILVPEAMPVVMLVFVLASPVLLGLIIWRERM